MMAAPFSSTAPSRGGKKKKKELKTVDPPLASHVTEERRGKGTGISISQLRPKKKKRLS